MKIIGILNFTPNSTSDGGDYFDYDRCLIRAQEMVQQGVDIIDFGAEATNPKLDRYSKLTFEEEFLRLKDVFPDVVNIAHKHNKLVSIDTYKYKIAEFAIDHGVDIINDQTGCKDENMIKIIKNSKKKVIAMHSLTIPSDRGVIISPEKDIVLELKNWGMDITKKLDGYGIPKSDIIFDPGIGFGNNFEQSWKIIRDILSFKDIGVEICVGHSRKGCMRYIGEENAVTLAASVYLMNKVDYLRVHDVDTHKKLFNALSN